MALTDKQIREGTDHCYIGFGSSVDGPVMLFGPTPHDLPAGGTVSILMTKKSQRRLLRELVAALSI